MNQTSDLFAISVMLDTSAIHGASISGAPFQVLKGLVNAGLVEVFIPKLAAEEFRTRWRERNSESVLQAQKALKALSGESTLPPNVGSQASAVASSISDIDWESRSKEFLSGFLDDNGFKVLPLTIEECVSAWDDYFSGKLPSQKIKYRPDIPDAHIVSSLRQFALDGKIVLFVSTDKGLSQAASNIEHVLCFEGIEGLVKSANLKAAVQKWQVDAKWHALQSTLPVDDITSQVREFIFENSRELFSSGEVEDSIIPEDNHTATISMFDEPSENSLVGPEDWGGGLLRYQAVISSECLLSWAVYRGDAYYLPEWVSVSGEVNDHYLDAEGYALVEATVDITVRIRVENEEGGLAGSIADISFEDGSLELALAELT